MIPPHVIRTERLVLRWFRPLDADVLLAVYNDPAFIRNVGDRGVRTLEGARQALASFHSFRAKPRFVLASAR